MQWPVHSLLPGLLLWGCSSELVHLSQLQLLQVKRKYKIRICHKFTTNKQTNTWKDLTRCYMQQKLLCGVQSYYVIAFLGFVLYARGTWFCWSTNRIRTKHCSDYCIMSSMSSSYNPRWDITNKITTHNLPITGFQLWQWNNILKYHIQFLVRGPTKISLAVKWWSIARRAPAVPISSGTAATWIFLNVNNRHHKFIMMVFTADYTWDIFRSIVLID